MINKVYCHLVLYCFSNILHLQWYCMKLYLNTYLCIKTPLPFQYLLQFVLFALRMMTFDDYCAISEVFEFSLSLY